MVERTLTVTGLGFVAARGGLTILQRTDQDFISAVLDELKSENGRENLKRSLASERDSDQNLKLFQPVQRTFHVALVEVACTGLGRPRLDRERIDGAGLVLRRVSDDRPGLEAWMEADREIADYDLRGWVRLTEKEADIDPDPGRRPPKVKTGHPEIDRRLRELVPALSDSLAERVVPLFVAPPEVCKAARRTILYGLVPVASHEVGVVDDDLPLAIRHQVVGGEADPAGYRPAEISDLLPFLRASDPEYLPPPELPLQSSHADDPRYADFVQALYVLAVGFDAFGESTEGLALYALLNEIPLTYLQLPYSFAGLPANFHEYVDGLIRLSQLPAGEVLKKAARVLFEGKTERLSFPAELFSLADPSLFEDENEGTLEEIQHALNQIRPHLVSLQTDGRLRFPPEWPAIPPELADRINAAAKAALEARFAAIGPGHGRLDELGRRYRLRAFVRVKRKDQCPPDLVWSDYSDPFTIAPWYESAGVPPVQVALPNPTVAFLRKLKPNVAFALPEAFYSKMPNKGILSGETRLRGGIGLNWICTFSIPIITLCAFIVLNIFLQLLNIIFWWLPFVKICLPVPKR